MPRLLKPTLLALIGLLYLAGQPILMFYDFPILGGAITLGQAQQRYHPEKKTIFIVAFTTHAYDMKMNKKLSQKQEFLVGLTDTKRCNLYSKVVVSNAVERILALINDLYGTETMTENHPLSTCLSEAGT